MTRSTMHPSSPLFIEPVKPLYAGDIALRPWVPSDAEQVWELCRDAEIPRWTLMPDPLTMEDAQHFVDTSPDGWATQETAQFAVCPTEDPGRVIGAMGSYTRPFRIGHVGYWVAASERGRGVATGALRRFVEWAFTETGLGRLEMHIIPGNIASERAAQRAGFVREGLQRGVIEQRGERVDGIAYGMVADDHEPGRLIIV